MVNTRDELRVGLPPPPGAPPVEWRVTEELVGYEQALAAMQARVAAIAAEDAPELVWLLEHPPLYTAGTSANPADVIDSRFPVYETGRGGLGKSVTQAVQLYRQAATAGNSNAATRLKKLGY